MTNTKIAAITLALLGLVSAAQAGILVNQGSPLDPSLILLNTWTRDGSPTEPNYIGIFDGSFSANALVDENHLFFNSQTDGPFGGRVEWGQRKGV